MNTALSTKRMYVHPVSSEKKEGAWASFGLPFGVLLMVLGAVLRFDLAAIAGFFFSATSFMYLNAMFWGKWFDRNPEAAAHQVEDALRSRID